METHATAPFVYVSDDVARKVTIAHTLLRDANYGLEHLDRLLSADEPDLAAARKELTEAFRLSLIVEEELEDIEHRRNVARTWSASI